MWGRPTQDTLRLLTLTLDFDTWLAGILSHNHRLRYFVLWGLKALDTALVGAVPYGLRGRVVRHTVHGFLSLVQLLMLVGGYVGQKYLAIFARGDNLRLVIGAL